MRASPLFPSEQSKKASYLYKSVYKSVREPSKVAGGSIFEKEMVVVPIHCHGNHWTFAIINLKLERFEYYDSLRGEPGLVLHYLRQWLQACES